MGIFNNDREYRDLIKIVKECNLDESDKNFLINYIEDVRFGKRNNDFYDFDTLKYCVLDGITNYLEDVKGYFYKILESFKILLPLGEETPNYKLVKSLILTSGMIVDKSLFALFDNPVDAFDIGRKASESKNPESAISYASLISPYCINQETLKFEILSYIVSCKSAVFVTTTLYLSIEVDSSIASGH